MVVADSEVSDLLVRVYVEGGFTKPERATALFAPSTVRSRGYLLCARPQDGGTLAGMVIVVPPNSGARRLAGPDETEMQLLAVDQIYRGFGLGRALVRAALDVANEQGFRRMVLWTQPTMKNAQRLYESVGFVRAARRDPTHDGKQFLAYEKLW